MAKEILAIPEHLLCDVILVIRAGLHVRRDTQMISDETRDNLKQWCKDMTEYIEQLAEEK